MALGQRTIQKLANNYILTNNSKHTKFQCGRETIHSKLNFHIVFNNV